MFKVIAKDQNRSLDNLRELIKSLDPRAINAKFNDLNNFIGTRFVTRLRLSMSQPKTGRRYGSHVASAPGESPAIQTGQLYKTTAYRTRGYDLEVGYNEPYGRYLELGIGLAPRPNLKPVGDSINDLYKSFLDNFFNTLVG